MIHQQVEFLIKRDYLKEWLGEIIHWHTIIVSSVFSLVSSPFHPSFTYAYHVIYLPLIHVKSDLFSIHNDSSINDSTARYREGRILRIFVGAKHFVPFQTCSWFWDLSLFRDDLIFKSQRLQYVAFPWYFHTV